MFAPTEEEDTERKWFPFDMSTAVKKFLREGPRDERIFKWVTNAKFSAMLLAIESAEQLPHITAGTFRRLFMNRVYHFTGGDKALMKKYTLHHSDYVLELRRSGLGTGVGTLGRRC